MQHLYGVDFNVLILVMHILYRMLAYSILDDGTGTSLSILAAAAEDLRTAQSYADPERVHHATRSDHGAVHICVVSVDISILTQISEVIRHIGIQSAESCALRVLC